MTSNVVLRKARGVARRLNRLRKHAGELRGDGANTGSIELWIDGPAEDARVETNVLKVEGWAYSQTGAITQMAVSLDFQELGQVEYGLNRVDVMNTFNLASERCGFSGVVDLPKNVTAGAHTLRVVATDDRGHKRTMRRQITVTESGQAAMGMTYWIDAPQADTVTSGRLEISGWAFSPASPIWSVVAYIDGTQETWLTHGIARDDVYEVYPAPFAHMSGFCGHIEFPNARPGKHVLTLRFTTRNDTTATVSRNFVFRPSALPYLEIERAQWRGDTVTIKGCAFMPGKRLPWMVSAYTTDGALLGSTRVKLSRPDVRQRFPDAPGAGQSGFELVCPVPAPQAAPTAQRGTATLTLTIQCVDADGQVIKDEVVVTHRPDELGQTLAASRIGLEDLVWQVRLRTGAEPSILNLTPDYQLASILKGCDIFTLPGKRDKASALGDGGSGLADIVVVADEATAQAAMKAQTARYVTATIKPVKAGTARGGKPGGAHDAAQAGAVSAEWTPEAQLRAIPSVSIVIPVYNKIEYTRPCVERILETAHSYIPLEVVVVDDCSTDATAAVIAELARADARVRYVRNETNSGFLLSSNHGAEVATGDILIFLNNDTLPEPRWIEPLIQALNTQPAAGVVGGKLMYPDGTLQEAGGVIYNNGDGANFGRNSADPEHPLFQTLREVDYVSGALLATPRALFLELGKFDERYTPAYCEDSDYCFRVREAGQRVYYQPESSIVHFEGVSNGRDTSQGMKRYQVINTQKFHQRWQEALTRQGPPPDNYDRQTLNRIAVRYERECDPETGTNTPKRALVAFSSVPEFNHEGGSRQHAALVDFLQDLGWQVTVLAVHKPGDEMYTRLLQQRGIQVYCGHRCIDVGDNYLEEFADLARDGQFQLALMAPWHLTEESLPSLRTFSPHTRIFTNTMDLHFLRDIRGALASAGADKNGGSDKNHARTSRTSSASSASSASNGRQTLDADGAVDVMIPPALGVTLIRELNTYANSDLVTTVSVEETTLLRSFLGAHSRVELLPHTEAIPASPIALADRRGMLFVGNFRHPPNVDAVEYLLSEVLPLVDPAVLRAHPINIVGTDLPDSLRTLARNVEGVRMLGWVPEITPYLHHARINLVPLLHGAGTKVKLIQALMTGTPSVTTLVGAEGLLLEDERQALIAESPEQFARAMTRLATDDALWSRLALASRDHVLARHGPDVVRARFGALIDQVMRTPSRAMPGASTADVAPADQEPADAPRGVAAMVQ